MVAGRPDQPIAVVAVTGRIEAEPSGSLSDPGGRVLRAAGTEPALPACWSIEVGVWQMHVGRIFRFVVHGVHDNRTATGSGSVVAVADAVDVDSVSAMANITDPPLAAADLTLQRREADVQAVAVAASTAWATLPTWVISTLRGLACSATGMVMARTPSWYTALMCSRSRLSPRNS